MSRKWIAFVLVLILVVGFVYGSVYAVNPNPTVSIKSFTDITLTQTGDVANGNVQYKTEGEVIATLPEVILVTLENDISINVPITWVDTDYYNHNIAKSYTFTAEWGKFPDGIDNNDNILPPACEVEVKQGEVKAEEPFIINDLDSMEQEINFLVELRVDAKVDDGGTLSYKWYKVDDINKSNKTLIDGAFENIYLPNTSVIGTYFYYCEIANTKGSSVVKVDSDVAEIKINPIDPTQEANIIEQPQDVMGYVGEEVYIEITAEVTDGGTLKYNWLKRDSSGSIHVGDDSRICKVNTEQVGTFFYRCEIVNSLEGNSLTTHKLSEEAKVEIRNTPTEGTMKGYSPVLLSQTGNVANSDVQYKTAEEVIKALPKEIEVFLQNQSKIFVPISWSETDKYDASVPGEYMFTAIWGNLPNGVDNNEDLKPPVCEVTVAEGVSKPQTPQITKNLEDVKGDVGCEIILEVDAIVNDSGVLTYKWFKVDDKNKNNKQMIDGATTKVYAVNTENIGISFYYCEVINTKSGQSGELKASIESSVSKVTITPIIVSKSIKNYVPVTLIQFGNVDNNNVQYRTASEVISALPATIGVTLEDNSMINIPLVWSASGNYNPRIAGVYRFIASWGDLPNDVDNDDNILPPVCDLLVEQGPIYYDDDDQKGSKTIEQKLPGDQLKELISEIDDSEDSTELNLTQEIQDNKELVFPKNFIEHEKKINLTIEHENMSVIINNKQLSSNLSNLQDSGLLDAKELKSSVTMTEVPILEVVKSLSNDGLEGQPIGRFTDVKWDIRGFSGGSVLLPIPFDEKILKNSHNLVVYVRHQNDDKTWQEWRAVEIEHIDMIKKIVYARVDNWSTFGLIYIQPTFKDIDNHWAKEAIEGLHARGIVKGFSKAEFRPEEPIKRADLVTLLVRCFKLSSKNTEDLKPYSQNIFKDVDSAEYYGKSLAIAKDLGIVKGYLDNRFMPNKSVTREEMMVLIDRAVKKMNMEYTINVDTKKTLTHIDKDKISDFAFKSVKAMIDNKLISIKETRINPKDKATRAEMADILYNIIKARARNILK